MYVLLHSFFLLNKKSWYENSLSSSDYDDISLSELSDSILSENFAINTTLRRNSRNSTKTMWCFSQFWVVKSLIVILLNPQQMICCLLVILKVESSWILKLSRAREIILRADFGTKQHLPSFITRLERYICISLYRLSCKISSTSEFLQNFSRKSLQLRFFVNDIKCSLNIWSTASAYEVGEGLFLFF